MTRVRAILRVDLARHVQAGGGLTAAAEHAAWSVLATAAPGQAVDVNVGEASWLSQRLAHILCEGLADAGIVQVSGQDGTALAKIAALLDRAGE